MSRSVPPANRVVSTATPPPPVGGAPETADPTPQPPDGDTPPSGDAAPAPSPDPAADAEPALRAENGEPDEVQGAGQQASPGATTGADADSDPGPDPQPVLRAEDGEPLDDEPAPVYVNGAEDLPAQELPAEELPAEELPAEELPAEDRTEAFPAEETAAEPVVVDAPRALDPVRVHYIWEGALAVLLLGLVAVAFVRFPEARSVDFFSGLLTAAVVPTVLAMAFSLSLRGAVPNLAVVPLCALGAATYAATVGPQGTGTGVLRALGVTALAGLLVGALVVGLRIPAWAASGAVGLLTAGFAVAIAPGTFQVVEAPALWGTGSALFAAVAAVSITAGLLCLVPAVRRTLGAYRGQATAPTRSVLACVVAVCVLVLSSAVAGAAGLLLVFTTRTASGGLAPELWLALAAVVAGGASVYGRRVGVAGTVLGVVLLITVYRLWLLWHGVALGVVGVAGVLAVAGIAATVGLLATPLVEWAGRRAEVVDSP